MPQGWDKLWEEASLEAGRSGSQGARVCHRCGEVGAATNQVSGVQCNEERNEQHQKRPIYTKLQIYTQRVPPWMHTYFLLRAKFWLRGGVRGQFPKNLN